MSRETWWILSIVLPYVVALAVVVGGLGVLAIVRRPR